MSITSSDFKIYDVNTISTSSLMLNDLTISQKKPSSPYSFIFPSKIGTNGQVLSLNSSLELEWSTPSNTAFPVGIMMSFLLRSAPSGWLICDGAAVSRTIYASLFSVIGTTFGAGDGSTTFNLPNMTDRFPRMIDGTNNNIGDLISDSTKSPNNPFTGLTNVQWNNHSHTLSNTTTVGADQGCIDYGTYQGDNQLTDANGAHQHTVTINNGGDVETAPIHVIVLYCIKI